MRRLGDPAVKALRIRASQSGSPAALDFLSTLLDANIEYLSFALSSEGVLASFREFATPTQVEACLASMLIYDVVQFAHDEIAKNSSELIAFLGVVTGIGAKQVMLRFDQLRKAPKSEEWMLYRWMVSDLGGDKPEHSVETEREFAYQYLSYIGQYKPVLQKSLARLSSDGSESAAGDP